MPDNPRYVNGTYKIDQDTDWNNAFGEADGRPAHLLRQDALAELDKPQSPVYTALKLDFKYIDLDSNGFLDTEEIKEGVKNSPDLADLAKNRSAQFDMKRLVHDGKNDARGISMRDIDELGRREVAAEHAKNDPLELKMAAEFLKKYFGKVNRAGDGFLSKDELGQLIVDPNLKPDFRRKFLLVERNFDAISELNKDKVLRVNEHNGLTQRDLQVLIANNGRVNLSRRR